MLRTLSKCLLNAVLLLLLPISGVASAALIGAPPGVRPLEASAEILLQRETISSAVPGFPRLSLSESGGVTGAAPGGVLDLNALAVSVSVEEFRLEAVRGE